MALDVTAIVMSRNEIENIEATVRALAFCHEVVVVDSLSVDGTREMAERCGARVVDFDWDGAYPKKKQWSLENCGIETDWVLFVDADEQPTKQLANEIPDLIRNSPFVAFDIPLEYWFRGKRIRHGRKISKRSLLRVGKCHFPVIDDLKVPHMWEVEGHYQPIADGPVGTATGLLQHRDQDPLYDWFARHNRYSEWEAYLRLNPQTAKSVRAARSSEGQIFDRLPFKPIILVAYSLLLRGGFRDGLAGFDYAIAQAFYQWQVSVKVRESRKP